MEFFAESEESWVRNRKISEKSGGGNNEVSAFVWEKLQNPISKADLLQAILDEYEVEKAVAAADLDALLKTLKEYNVIEDD